VEHRPHMGHPAGVWHRAHVGHPACMGHFIKLDL
jgi:hypothetical protein